MIFDSLGISLIYGLIRGGKISGIADIDIKKPVFFILGFLFEFGLLNLSDRFPVIMSYRAFIHFLDYLMLFIGLWYNRHNRYMMIIGFGIFLNFIVIFANGGRMPVSIDALKAAGLYHLIPGLLSDGIATHQALTASTRLKFLSDVLFLPKPYPLPKAFSIGDLLIFTGTFLMVTNAMLKKTGKKYKEVEG
ncbi:DUF5317 domain-containing protein [Aceticella autotrophica]|uniref:DUF5317 domain-containing protein n=1 Tax=Aceticella autotrophica TaxID=2755338 RepID=A0A975AV55_9THEO|nr:DUF5317 domain-containing protein [Aceticella autotrophica]QSZ27002.1 DUF5317 domain-containing protein [Aceticella autotrophica]